MVPILMSSVVVLSSCGAQPSGDSVASKPQTNVSIAMGYTPNVQFAPFYVAQKLGYYKLDGLKIKFNYASEPNALALLSNGSVDFVDSGGDEVLAAGAAGLHVKYVLTQYSRFPSALFFLKSSGIKKVRDLEGKTIGIPEKAGASYYGLLALLSANHVPVSKVHIEVIGFDQVDDVATGKVAAAMGYAPNEPVELRAQGKSVGEFDVFHWANIAGAGLASSNNLIARKPGLVRAFVDATLAGLRFTLRHPERAFTMSKAFISDLTDPKLQRQVLNRVIAFWKPARVRLGQMDPAVWKKTASVLYRFNVTSNEVDPTNFYTNRFVD